MYNEVTGNTDIVTLTTVPELSTWAMVLAGFAGLGLTGFRRIAAASPRIEPRHR